MACRVDSESVEMAIFPLCYPHSASPSDGLVGKEEELESLVKKVEAASTAYGMEISPEKTKIMSNNANGLSKTIKVKGYNLETVTNFKYLGAIVTYEGTKREALTRIAQATSALTKLKTVWKDRKITSKHRFQILRSIVTSTFLYACETWTLTAELERRIQTFKMRCYMKIFGISFRDRITNEDVRNRVRAAIGPHDDLLSIVKTRKLRWYGHVTRATGLANTIMQATVPGGRRRGSPKTCWHDNIKEWTELPLAKTLRLAEDRDGWRKIIKTSVVPLQPPPPPPPKRLRAADADDDIHSLIGALRVCKWPVFQLDNWSTKSHQEPSGKWFHHLGI